MFSPVRALSTVLAVSALVAGAAPVAEAHEILVSSSPANGSTTTLVPAQVTLTFDQPAEPVGAIVLVTGPAGQVQAGAAVLVNSSVIQRVRPGSPAGRYTVTWRVTAADGHPASGQLVFTARAPSPELSAVSQATSAPPATGSASMSSATTAPSTTPAPSAGPSTSPAPPSTTPVTASGQASGLWWVAGAGAVLLLLLAALLRIRKPHSARGSEGDPQV